MAKRAIFNPLLIMRRRMASFPTYKPPPAGPMIKGTIVEAPSPTRALSKFFGKHPFLTNCATFGGLYVSAEMSQQYLQYLLSSETQDFALQWPSVLRYAVLGFVAFPPIVYNWYKWLDATLPGSSKKTVVKKMMLDQFVLGPPQLALFFLLMSAMEGARNVTEECEEKFLSTFVIDSLYWLPVQAVNFRLVPAKFRVVYLGTAFFVWLNILCAIKSAKKHTGEN